MLNQLKTFDADRMDVDEMVALHTFARILRAEYDHMNLDVPEWLDDQTRALRLAIKAKTQDFIAKRLKEAKARLNSLRTTEERRNDLKSEVDKLEKQLQTA